VLPPLQRGSLPPPNGRRTRATIHWRGQASFAATGKNFSVENHALQQDIVRGKNESQRTY